MLFSKTRNTGKSSFEDKMMGSAPGMLTLEDVWDMVELSRREAEERAGLETYMGELAPWE